MVFTWSPLPMPDPIKIYLKQIGAALAAGNATEHTHRPALKALVEALAPGVTAITSRNASRAGRARTW